MTRSKESRKTAAFKSAKTRAKRRTAEAGLAPPLPPARHLPLSLPAKSKRSAPGEGQTLLMRLKQNEAWRM